MERGAGCSEIYLFQYGVGCGNASTHLKCLNAQVGFYLQRYGVFFGILVDENV